jgi:hypothetical protein
MIAVLKTEPITKTEPTTASLMAMSWLILLVCACVSFSMESFPETAAVETNYVPPPPGGDWTTGSIAEEICERTSLRNSYPELFPSGGELTLLVVEQAEYQDLLDEAAQSLEPKTWPAFGAYSDNYEGLVSFWADDILSNALASIGCLFVHFCVAPIFSPLSEPSLFRSLPVSSWPQLVCLHMVIWGTAAFVFFDLRAKRCN